MKRKIRHYTITGVLFLALQILVSCSGDNGTSTPPNDQNLTLSISGTFAATVWYVSPDQIRVLFDGKLVSVEGCKDLICGGTVNITANTICTRGSHSVEFEMLRQFCDLSSCNGGQKYKVTGNVTVLNSSGGVIQQIPLDKQTVTLDTGDKVKWQIEVN